MAKLLRHGEPTPRNTGCLTTTIKSLFMEKRYRQMVALVKQANPEIPGAVGFGIFTHEQAVRMATFSRGMSGRMWRR